MFKKWTCGRFAQEVKGRDSGPFEGSWTFSNIFKSRTKENTSQTLAQGILIKSCEPHNLRRNALWCS